MKKTLFLTIAFLALVIWPQPGAADAGRNKSELIRPGGGRTPAPAAGNVLHAPAPADDTDKNGPRPRPNRPSNHPPRKPRKPAAIFPVQTQIQTRTQTTITGPVTWELPAAVLRVADGDTIIVRVNNHKDIEVRLYGIDCPEWNQPGGREAAAFLRSLQGRQVTIREMDTDSYGRTVALVEFNGRSVNLDLAARGHAWYYTHYCRSQPICGQLRAAEAEARAARRGLWSGQNPVAPWEWRKKY